MAVVEVVVVVTDTRIILKIHNPWGKSNIF
jgi:hypothetical protein